jgi:hypothetical protein
MAKTYMIWPDMTSKLTAGEIERHTLRRSPKKSGRRVGLGESLQGCVFVLKSTRRVA